MLRGEKTRVAKPRAPNRQGSARRGAWWAQVPVFTRIALLAAGLRCTPPVGQPTGESDEKTEQGLHPDRADDRRRDPGHPRGDRDPELHQVPGASETERSEGEPEGVLHRDQGVLPGEG